MNDLGDGFINAIGEFEIKGFALELADANGHGVTLSPGRLAWPAMGADLGNQVTVDISVSVLTAQGAVVLDGPLGMLFQLRDDIADLLAGDAKAIRFPSHRSVVHLSCTLGKRLVTA